MRKNRLLVALSAAVVTLTTWAVPGPTAQATAPSTAARVKAAPGITWGACTDPTLRQVRAQCGYVTVPMDYRHPSGDKIQLAVSRLRHTTLKSQGVMLVNPGGPGGSGLIYSAL